MKATRGRSCLVLAGFVLLASRVLAQESDYQFPPPDAWGLLAQNDASVRLAEGFEGLEAEPRKDTTLEPVDGAGGFDNVAPRLGVEEGPGGLEWDPSPTYRTRYQGGTDYAAGSGKRVQGNNWFTTIPYVVPYSTYRFVRFDANTYRIYTQSGSEFWGQLGNLHSKITETGTSPNRTWKLRDTRGKIYTFEEASPASGRLTKLEGLGGAQITITYAAGSISVFQMSSATAGSEVRRFKYVLTADRVDRIDIGERTGPGPDDFNLYRQIDFTYHENVTGSGPVESTTGDLVGIEDWRLLSPTGIWESRRWAFKYWTKTDYTEPGYRYQVRAVLGPQSVREWQAANGSTQIYTKTTTELASYVDRFLSYESDKRLDQLDIRSGCGCGGSQGVYNYTWDINGLLPSDLNGWHHRVTIASTATGASRIIDYNKYGQTLNSIVQEVAGNPSSRRWIRTWTHDTTGRLTESFSPKACTSYTDSTHVVVTNETAGQRFKFSYDGNSALAYVRLRKPNATPEELYYQVRKTFDFRTSGDRRRFIQTSHTTYPFETTSDVGGLTTIFAPTYHSTDALAVKKVTTTLPAVATGENGSGSAVVLYDYFEADGLHTWTKDGDGFVHYMGYDPNRRTLTKQVRDLNTASLPSGVPPSPDTVFNTTAGLNLVTDYEYDALRRITKEVRLPAFSAWNGSSVVSVTPTRRWWYTQLTGGETVTIEYPHVDSEVYNAALTISVHDAEGHVVTSALGELNVAYRSDDTLSDDFLPSYASLADWTRGTIVRRTDFTYAGDKVTQEAVWSVATNGSTKFTTTHVYDAAGRKEKTTNPVGTITRFGYDVLNRLKSRKVGTIDGGGSDNMTLVEERFYDDEEDPGTGVGDGNLTRVKLYSHETGGASRNTDYAYDYRRRVIQIDEPENVRETRSYYDPIATKNTNRAAPNVVSRYATAPTTTLMAKVQSLFDTQGRVHEVRTHGVSGGSESGYASVRTWRNGRGLVIKEQSEGKVFGKTEYDGAGRAKRRSVSYDTAETAYAAAFDLTGDTVIQETRYALDPSGAAELVGSYERRHNGTGTGPLDVGSSKNGRAQYVATWYDHIHRATHSVNYGTNGGANLSSRPSGSEHPPSASSASSLVTKYSYTVKSELEIVTDTSGILETFAYDDPGRLIQKIDNYVNETPGPGTDEDRTVEYTYNAAGQVLKTTAKASTNDQVTENVYGVTRGSGDTASLIASNDLLRYVNYPDPDSGQPTGASDEQEEFAYNAQGEIRWKKDQNGTQRKFSYDPRGRLESDTMIAAGIGIDSDPNGVWEIARTYDELDRPIWVTSVSGMGAVLNEVQFDYGAYDRIVKIWQDPDSIVDDDPIVGTSPKVQFTYTYPTDGTTPIRLSSVTYPSLKVITEVYNSGADDILNRISGRNDGSSQLFRDKYLGLGRLVERQYGSSYIHWTLVGTDSANQDNYIGLDRFARIDQLQVKDTVSGIHTNNYAYTYNNRSQVTIRDNLVSGSYAAEFDEIYAYDNLGRLTNHKRGVYSGGSMTTTRLNETWTLDRSGNSTQYQEAVGYTSIASTFNASNEIVTRAGESYSGSYNDRGDLTRRGAATTGNTQTFDAWGRLVKVSTYGGSILSKYKYNGMGQMIERTDSPGLPGIRYYYNDAWQVIEEIRISNGAVYDWYVWGTQYIDDIVAHGSGYFVLDTNFNVVTRLNASYNTIWRYVYDHYGRPKQTDQTWATWYPITVDLPLFTGRTWHKDHGQYDYRHRVQDPELWSFTRRDPIGIWGDAANFGNGYAYVRGDPINYIDPSGLVTTTCGLHDAWLQPASSGGDERCVCRWKCDCAPHYVCHRGPNNTVTYDITYVRPSGADCRQACIDAGSLTTACCPYTSAAPPPPPVENLQYIIVAYNVGLFGCFLLEIVGPMKVAMIAKGVGAGCGRGIGRRVWPNNAQEMDDMLGFAGRRIPDGPTTCGRGKVVWECADEVKIIGEAHPYDKLAPRLHKDWHWHLDTPSSSHQRFLPGDPIPGM